MKKRGENIRLIASFAMIAIVTMLFFVQKHRYEKEIRTVIKTEETLRRNRAKNELLVYGLNDGVSLAGGRFFGVDNREIDPRRLVEKLPMVILRYGIYGCDRCANAQLAIIAAADSAWTSRMAVMISFPGDDEKQRYLQGKTFCCGVIDYKDDMQVLRRPDSLSSPYYFVLGKDLSVTKIFIPTIGFDRHTIDYLTTVFDGLSERAAVILTGRQSIF